MAKKLSSISFPGLSEPYVIGVSEYQHIAPEIVRDLFKCAMSYVNHIDELTFTSSGENTLFDDSFSVDKPLMDCSSMMQAWVQGIPYDYSKFAGKDNIRHYRYGITLPQNPYSTEQTDRDKYYTHDLAHYFYDQGYCFKPNSDYSNIAAGDIIFVSFSNRSGEEFHDNAFMHIDHCSLVVGFKDKTHLTCLHTSQQSTFRFYDVCVKKSDLDPTSGNSYNDAIVLVARLPFRNTNSISGEPIVSNDEEFTSTSASNGLLKTISLGTPLKANTTYTAVVYVENAYDQTTAAATNYVGLRASYESGAADATLINWQYNQYPDDNIYYLHFVTAEDPITALKVYVLNTNVSGHHYKFLKLYEGFVYPAVD